MTRVAWLLVIGHLVGQTYTGGPFRQCHYESIHGEFTVTVSEWRGCPLIMRTEIEI